MYIVFSLTYNVYLHPINYKAYSNFHYSLLIYYTTAYNYLILKWLFSKLKTCPYSLTINIHKLKIITTRINLKYLNFLKAKLPENFMLFFLYIYYYQFLALKRFNKCSYSKKV